MELFSIFYFRLYDYPMSVLLSMDTKKKRELRRTSSNLPSGKGPKGKREGGVPEERMLGSIGRIWVPL